MDARFSGNGNAVDSQPTTETHVPEILATTWKDGTEDSLKSVRNQVLRLQKE